MVQLVSQVAPRSSRTLSSSDHENVKIVFQDGLGYDTKKLLVFVQGRYGGVLRTSSPGNSRISRAMATSPREREIEV